MWVDHMRVSLRNDPEVALLSFYSQLPDVEERPEVCRIMTSRKHVHAMIDVLCRTLGYYPDKQE